MGSKITIILDNENAQINLEGKIKIKDGAIVLGKTLGMLVKGYDETVVVKAAAEMTKNEEMRKYAEAHGCGEERSAGDTGRCGWCGSVNGTRYLKKEGCWECADCGVKWIKTPLRDIKKNSDIKTDYPQAHELNEYRYLSPAWLDEITKGLTAGQEKYPGET